MNVTGMRTRNTDAIDRALAILIEAGISFEVVDRCPADCASCDSTLLHAA